MATDLEYARKHGLTEIAVNAAQSRSGVTEESIARDLGLSHRETLAILDEIANVPATMAAPVATGGVLSASIAFVAPATGGSPITGYEITSSVGPVWTETTDLTTPIVVTGLTAVAQTFTIKAINDIGKSAASPASNSVTPTAS